MWACKYGFNVHGLCKTKLSCIRQDPKASRFNPTSKSINFLGLLVYDVLFITMCGQDSKASRFNPTPKSINFLGLLSMMFCLSLCGIEVTFMMFVLV